ncbi:flagellar biosynthesis anti-sigma factor FlgM [Halanaerobium sp. MA284_MarDTE_T2]|uniref:flagellar biosynthesis anti-sigma factor FlgM n=1 Tax=Halanaerobium sp. MA284_MarDTE_T2 TaxID=2183913 RepID=UPI000DF215A2|nr:flagellar biosynthesis anti-sigma factor FlgM [Halanaerobium sp. MA284_MarDTE_T2]RCW48213.1 FlgM family anti-sigma-28 factor [Halanaerobium sp. MA284_MarDTE_T2]
MKINDLKAGRINQYYKIVQQQAENKDKADNDKMQISDRAKEIASAKKALKKSPAIREEKVAEIKAKINAGSYEVDSKKLAQKMLNQIKQVQSNESKTER